MRTEQLDICDPPAGAVVDSADASWRVGPHGSWPLDPLDDPSSDALHRASHDAYIAYCDGGDEADHTAYYDLAQKRYRLLHRRHADRRRGR